MTVLEIDRNPSPRDLRVFGRLLPLFTLVFGTVVWWRSGSVASPSVVWGVGAALSSVFALWPASRRRIYVGWMYAVFPIGWLISHLLFGAIYFLVITPIGIGLRLLGKAPLERRFNRTATTYWAHRGI